MTTAFKFLLRYCLLAAAAALLGYGLVAWHDRGMAIDGILFYDNHWRPHPMHLLVLGICLLPIAMWQVFALDVKRQEQREQRERNRQRTPAPPAQQGANVTHATPEDG